MGDIIEAAGMGRQHRQTQKGEEEGVSSLPAQAQGHQRAFQAPGKIYSSQGTDFGAVGPVPQNSGQGPRPRHSCPTFPAAMASGGRGLGRDGQEGEAARHPDVACSLCGPLQQPREPPQPAPRPGAGRSRSTQADQESPAKGPGYSKCGPPDPPPLSPETDRMEKPFGG